METRDRLRDARERLSLTQEYVSSVIGVSRTALVQMENGKRKITEKELAKLCTLYGISADYAIGTEPKMDNAELFARGFEKLPRRDQEEILGLIEYKNQLSRKR